ncbi:MAG: hypothetical protein Q8R78_00770 [Candidatus Omnitrophota bacterium]|nr:hypothetical protein [Candidatus Omnitrophota bacterium]
MAETTTVDPAAPAPAAPVAAPAPSDWRAGLTGEFAPLAQDKTLELFKGNDWTEAGPQLAKAYVEARKLINAKAPALTVPGEGATPEQVAAYRKATGVPDAPDGYAITWPELPPGDALDEAAQGAWLTRMHQIGAPAHIVQAFATLYGQHVNTLHNGYRREAEAAGQELRRDWGPNYDANLGRANRAIQQYGGDALVDLFAQNGMGRHPLVIRSFAKIGDDLVEHGAMAGDTVGRVTPEEAQERMKTLQADLLKVPHGSDQAKALIDQIIQYTKIAQGQAR